MSFDTVPQFSAESDTSQAIPLRKLCEILLAQERDLTLLCTIVEYLRGFKHVGLDQQDATKYTAKLTDMKKNQANRFEEVDDLINNNLKDIKKGKTTSETVFRYGREVRKLEAGLRTLKLFAMDVVEMLKKGSGKIDRTDERIRYFEGRASVLEVEMQLLLNKIPG